MKALRAEGVNNELRVEGKDGCWLWLTVQICLLMIIAVAMNALPYKKLNKVVKSRPVLLRAEARLSCRKTESERQGAAFTSRRKQRAAVRGAFYELNLIKTLIFQR